MPNNQKQIAPEKYIFCANQLKTTTEKFVWMIDNFFHRQKKCGEGFESEDFMFKAPNGRLLKWRMKMFPNGKDEQFRDYVGLSLSFIGDSNSEEVEAKFWISIRKSDAEEVKLRYFHHKFGPTWENAEMIARKDLFNFRNGYLSGDRLTIVCKLVVLQESIGKAPDIEVPECRVPEDVGYLFEKSLFPDCKITSEDNKEFKVHKCILGCRSPVFAAMFEHEMLEKNSNIIDISDMKGKVIEAMLRFIYSGKEPDLDVGMAEDLLIAAEKYELIRLKLICERKLINSLANGNACEFFVLANLHSAKHLKAKAIEYIKMHGNEILESEEWKTLANEELKDQILKAILAK